MQRKPKLRLKKRLHCLTQDIDAFNLRVNTVFLINI